MKKINLGCGGNILDGWENHDSDVDITKPLPYEDSSAQFILAEHCVEHITPHEAVGFFKECFRILVDGGVLRVAVPSVNRVLNEYTPEYGSFLKSHGWGDGGLYDSVLSLVLFHEHKSVWGSHSLATILMACGFSSVLPCSVGESSYKELCGVEGHGKVIGDKFNRIETLVVEAIK